MTHSEKIDSLLAALPRERNEQYLITLAPRRHAIPERVRLEAVLKQLLPTAGFVVVGLTALNGRHVIPPQEVKHAEG